MLVSIVASAQVAKGHGCLYFVPKRLFKQMAALSSLLAARRRHKPESLTPPVVAKQTQQNSTVGGWTLNILVL